MGVVRANQKPGARGKVIEHILLIGEATGLAPRGPVFAAAAQVGNRDHTALVKPDAARDIEIWSQAEVVTAAADQDSGVLAVQPRALLADDVQRYLRTVWRSHHLANRLHVAEGRRRFAVERRGIDPILVPVRIVTPPGIRFGIGHTAVEDLVALRDKHLLHRGRRSLLRTAEGVLEVIEIGEFGWSAVLEHETQPARGRLEALEHIGA